MRQLSRFFVIGLVMGAAEVVPGFSAATVAFVAGVYARVVDGLRQLVPGLMVVAKREGVGVAWTRLDGTFLVTLFAGMAVSIGLFGGAVTWLLANKPVLTGAFCGGLVVASILLVYRRLSRSGVDIVMGMLAGAAAGGLATLAIPVNLPPTPLNMFAAGVIAMCAWILPGTSGSLALMIIGAYSTVAGAMHPFDVVTLACFVIGSWFGLASLSQLLSVMLKRHRDETLSVLVGLMAGALLNLWPWKRTATYQLTAHGSSIPVVQEPVSPHIYASLTGQDPQVALAIAAAVAGFVLALLVARFSSESSVDSVK